MATSTWNPQKKFTTIKTKIVATTLFKLGRLSLKTPCLIACILLEFPKSPEKKLTKAPSYSSPYFMNENDFHKSSSQTLVAMKSEIALTNP